MAKEMKRVREHIEELIILIRSKKNEATNSIERTNNPELKLMYQGKEAALGEVHSLLIEKLMELSK
ncbi:hypothetical protein IFU39_16585 [Paenibacillus sp. CFBP 13594]|uniref:hypothetical protein n=1 Tax=Paenibacillus sp. CFBP 13594 TaxID=2774037 RepID=UPI00178756E5|nr:hypothetical protein [Paenibacillus sp. CFBP 13594]MBD8839431.1 hypothetical protein [Paenibacillus sp. CFBP 13594]